MRVQTKAKSQWKKILIFFLFGTGLFLFFPIFPHSAHREKLGNLLLLKLYNTLGSGVKFERNFYELATTEKFCFEHFRKVHFMKEEAC